MVSSWCVNVIESEESRGIEGYEHTHFAFETKDRGGTSKSAAVVGRSVFIW